RADAVEPSGPMPCRDAALHRATTAVAAGDLRRALPASRRSPTREAGRRSRQSDPWRERPTLCPACHRRAVVRARAESRSPGEYLAELLAFHPRGYYPFIQQHCYSVAHLFADGSAYV